MVDLLATSTNFRADQADRSAGTRGRRQVDSEGEGREIHVDRPSVSVFLSLCLCSTVHATERVPLEHSVHPVAKDRHDHIAGQCRRHAQ